MDARRPGPDPNQRTGDAGATDTALWTQLRDFVQQNVSGGVLLFGAAVIALIWSNSAFSASYNELWATHLSLGVEPVALTLSLQHWINDGLMAIFFLVVGLEIKRELLVGELDTMPRALLPAAAAAAGALVPALIFLAVVGPRSPEAVGWGVPMATDIAFALGVLAIIGRRVPGTLRIFVTALAIVDDLLAVLVIAIFYTSGINMLALGVAAVLVVALLVANRLGLRSLIVFGLLGLALWLAVLESGIHATIAGVLLAVTIPGPKPDGRHSDAPLVKLEHRLTFPTSYLIVPLFALANAGVTISQPLAEIISTPIVIAIFAGLILGKQIGITGATYAVTRLRLAKMPQDVSMPMIYSTSWVCAIGFTMSLFIAQLAYRDPQHLADAKIGILLASIVAGVIGFILLRFGPRTRAPD